MKVRAQAPERPRDELEVECSVCTRKCRRESDKKRHKMSGRKEGSHCVNREVLHSVVLARGSL